MANKKNYRKILANLGKELVDYGLTSGSGGNISIREGKFIYIKASGAWFKDARLKDYIKVPLRESTDNIFSKSPKPSCELKMHIFSYRRRKGISCIVHSHPIYSIILANRFKKLKGLTAEFIGILEKEVPVLKYMNPASDELAEEVSKVILHHNGLILSHHGIVTVGKSPKEALYRALLVENEAKITLLSSLFGRNRYLSKKVSNNIINSIHTEYRRKRLERQ